MERTPYFIIILSLFLAAGLAACSPTAPATAAAPSSAPAATEAKTAAEATPESKVSSTESAYPPAGESQPTVAAQAYPGPAVDQPQATLAAYPAETQPAFKAYPADQRVKLDPVDKVIEAFLSNNNTNLLPLIQFINAPCTTASGLGGAPKCEGSEKDGTQVSAFPILGSEGTFVRKEKIAKTFPVRKYDLYAVYKVEDGFKPANAEANFPLGKYALLLGYANSNGTQAVIVWVTDSGIIRLDMPTTMVNAAAFTGIKGEFLLAPQQ